MTSLTRREYQRKWYSEHREEQRQYGIKYRKEHRQELLAKKHIYNKEHSEQRIDYQKAYANAHAESIKVYRHMYYLAHREGIKQRSKAYRKTHKDERQINGHVYYEANKDHINEAAKEYVRLHRDQINDYKRQWAKDNPLKIRIVQAQKRARRKEAPGSGFSKQDFLDLWKLQNGHCYYCNRFMLLEAKNSDPLKVTIDHVIPLCKGGHHSRSNIVLACWECNIRKNQLLPSVFSGMLDL